MSEILNQLSQLFIQSIPTVIFVFVLLVILERLLFQPIVSIQKQREDATIGALARAREQANTAEAKSREYEETFQAVRQESYRLREEERGAALIEREINLKKAREQMQALLNEAQANIRKEVKAVKQELVKASQSLALEITEAVLARGVSNDAERGTPL